MGTVFDRIEQIKADPTAHFLVKELVQRMSDYDCVDFYGDLKLVTELAKECMEYYQNQMSQRGGDYKCEPIKRRKNLKRR